MQSAGSMQESDRLRLLLEDRYAPNRVLQRGAEVLIGCVIKGLPTASADGIIESWELLAHLAAGAVPPTAADPAVVEATQNALKDALPVASEWAGSATERSAAFHALDVVDAALEFVSGPARAEA